MGAVQWLDKVTFGTYVVKHLPNGKFVGKIGSTTSEEFDTRREAFSWVTENDPVDRSA